MENIDTLESPEKSFRDELNDLMKSVEGYKGPKLTASAGRIKGPSGEETWYNLPMDRVVQYMAPYGFSEKDYWVRDDGVKMLGKYVMVAANIHIRPKGTKIPTSLGEGIVCDTGSFAASNPRQLDIAVTWKTKGKRKKNK